MLTDKQEEKEIKRLKDILFPKNKSTNHQPKLNKEVNVYDEKTQRGSQPSKTLTTNILQTTTTINQRSSFINQSINKHHTITNISTLNNQQPQNLPIKHQINKLKLQINAMLDKWNQPEPQIPNLNAYSTSENIVQFQSHHQQLTRQHYLKNINQISKNLQKYNVYMYGIKQATQSMISTIPLVEENYLIKIQDVRAYKLFYLGKLLLAYFISKVQSIRINQLKTAWRNMIEFSQEMQEQRKRERQRRAINKGNNLFLRKNLLDKAFKKWRTNSALLKFKQTLNSHNSQLSITNNIKDVNQQQQQDRKCNKQLKETEFYCKNILKKEKIVQYLQHYLLSVTQTKLKESISNQNIEYSNSNKNKQSPYYLSQQIQIIFIDSNNSKAFSYINANKLFNKSLSSQISQSRLQNVIQSIPSQNKQSFQSSHQGNYKKYQFPIKHSLTQMCIDSSKIIRIPQIKRNQVFSLQVDASINQQLWIKTTKTHRDQQKLQILNKRRNINKRLIISEQVFYEQESLIEEQGYRYECGSILSSGIFYPLIHENSLIGMIRQYIYHSSHVINFCDLQIRNEDLQFVIESIKTSFQLSYGFQALKKQRRLVEDGYALRIVKMLKRLQSQVKEILKCAQSQDKISQDMINERMMGVLQVQMQKIFSVQRNKKDSNQKQQQWRMRVDKLINLKNVDSNRVKMLICVDNQDQHQQDSKFQTIYQTNQLKEQQNQINKIVNNMRHQLYSNSINKSFNIQTHRVNNNSIQQTVLSIKSTIGQHQLYFTFTKSNIINNNNNINYNVNYQHINNRNNSNSYIHNQHNIPPQQLIIDIINKYHSLLNNTINKYKLIKQSLNNQSIQQKQRKRHQIKQKLKFFYLNNIKHRFYNLRQNQKLIENKSQISNINKFIQECVNLIYGQIINYQLRNDNELSFNDKIEIVIEYNVRMNIKLYTKFKQQQESENTGINVSVKFMNEDNNNNKNNNNKQEQIDNMRDKYLISEVKYQILNNNNNQNQQIYDHNFQNNEQDNCIQFNLNKIQVLINRQQQVQMLINKQQQVNDDRYLFSNSQVEQVLKQIVNNYIQLTQSIHYQHYLSKNKQSYQKHNQTIDENKLKVIEQSINNQIVPLIKQNVFSISINHNNHNDNDELSMIINILNNTIQGMLMKYQLQLDSVNIITHKQNISKIMHQLSIGNNIETVKISSKYHQLLSHSTLSIYKQLLGSINRYKSNNNQHQQHINNNHQQHSLLYNVLKQLNSYHQYALTLKTITSVQSSTNQQQINQSTNLKQMNKLSGIISSSYLVISYLTLNNNDNEQIPILTIKLNNKSLQSKSYISIIQQSVSNMVSLIFNQYKSINLWKYKANKLNTTIQAINKLIKTNKQIITYNPNNNNNNNNNSSQCHQYQQANLIYRSLCNGFKRIRQYSTNISDKAITLISLSSSIKNKHNKHLLIQSLSKWRINTSYSVNHQLTHVLRDKIINNLPQSISDLQVFINKISIYCYDKVLLNAFHKISFYSKHSRILDFNTYKLKMLHSSIDQLILIDNQNNKVQMRRFFCLCRSLVDEKRRYEVKLQKRINLFILLLSSSKYIKKQIRTLILRSFNHIKNNYYANINYSYNKQININANISKSIDQRLAQSKNIQEVRDILSNQYQQYDIWIKTNKHLDQYILLSLSNKSSIAINNNSIKMNKQKLSKQGIYSIYQNLQIHNNILQTSNTIFISPQSSSQNNINNNINCNTLSLQNNNNLASNVVNLSNTINNELSFKQKDKLHSLSKCLNQFFTHYKIQLNIKLTHISSLYQTLKLNRYSIVMKRWKQYDQNILLMKTYQLTDNIYQLNIQTQNYKQKIKQQQKQIKQNQHQYHKLIKKEQQQKHKISKYQSNIQVLNKMLQYYQQIQKKQHDLFKKRQHDLFKKRQHDLFKKRQHDLYKSASKSASTHRKLNKINYYGAELSALSHQQMSIVLLSLTRWRQINANQKLNQLRINNFIKQIKILNKSVIQCSQSLQHKFKFNAFHQILNYSLQIKQLSLKQQQQQKQRLLLQIQKQNQRIQLQKMYQHKQHKFSKKDENNRTWKSQKLTNTQKSLSLGQKTTHENSKIQLSSMVSPNQIKQLPSIYDQTRNNNNETIEYEYYTPNQTQTQSLVDQLQQSFSQLNKRLVTFQKNHLTPQSQHQQLQQNNQEYFNNYELSEQINMHQRKQIDNYQMKQFNQMKQKIILQQQYINIPYNNSIQVMQEEQKMTQQEKIKFQLQRMRIKKLHNNKQNLTITQQQYDKLNKGNGYKLGGKTLRFLKRMGKLSSTQRQN